MKDVQQGRLCRMVREWIVEDVREILKTSLYAIQRRPFTHGDTTVTQDYTAKHHASCLDQMSS